MQLGEQKMRENNIPGERYKHATTADLSAAQIDYCLKTARADLEWSTVQLNALVAQLNMIEATIPRLRDIVTEWRTEIGQLENLRTQYTDED
jgi:hypothetical protein